MGRGYDYTTEQNRRATIMKDALELIAYGEYDGHSSTSLSRKRMREAAKNALNRVEESHRIEEAAEGLMATRPEGKA